MTSPRPAAVLGGNRIPFARANGPYATESNQAMLTAAIDGLVARFSLQDQHVDADHIGPVARQRAGDRGADAARGAGDDRDAAGQRLLPVLRVGLLAGADPDHLAGDIR
jgi:acetyl-CoA acetyltransferase